MAFLNRPGAKIFYEYLGSETSEKTVVTLVNGHTRSSGDFRMMSRYLNEAGVPCILLDNRASGKSEVYQPFTLNDMQDDVVAVWDELGITKSSILGISMGGFICQGLAIHNPEKIFRLALVSTASDPKWIKPTGGGWLNSAEMVEQKLASYFAPGFVEKNPLFFQTMVKQTKAAIAEGRFAERSDMQKEALIGRSWSDKLGQITAPTLVIHGAEDQVVDVESARELARSIHQADLKILDGVGHLILAEAPKLLYQEALAFFS